MNNVNFDTHCGLCCILSIIAILTKEKCVEKIPYYSVLIIIVNSSASNFSFEIYHALSVDVLHRANMSMQFVPP